MQAASVLFDRCAALGPILGRHYTYSKAGLLLDSNYSYGVGGDCVACRFVAPTTSDLVKVYFFANAKTGSPGQLTVELRNAATYIQPGSTLHATMGASAPPAANTWVGGTFGSPYECQQNDTYFICIGDAAGTPANNTTICYQSPFLYDANAIPLLQPARSTIGFISSTSCYSVMPLLLEFGDGTLLGLPYTDTTTWTPSTRERGVCLAGLDEDLHLAALVLPSGSPIDGVKIYDGDAAPGATPLASYSCDFLSQHCWLGYRFKRQQTYRIVCTFASSSGTPGYFEIADSTDDLKACGFGAGEIVATIDDGAGGWTDYAERWPHMALLIGHTPQVPRVMHHDLVMGGGL